MEENKELELNLDILDQQGSTTSTLGDLYGYFVFSEQFEKNIEKYKEKEEQTLDSYIQDVFANESVDEMESVFLTVLQADTSSIVKSEYKATEENNDWLSMIGFMMLGLLLTCGVWLLIEKWRKERKHHEN